LYPSLKIEEFLEMTRGKVIKIDSRRVNEGDYYIAFKGNRYDGNDFIHDAFNRGASGALSDSVEGKNILLVDNTKNFIFEVSRYILKKNKTAKRIVITGSTGKTTTKEITFFLLSKLGKVFKTRGNMNTEIGVPLSLISDRAEFCDAEFCIFEVGTDKPGDLSKLVDLIKPNISVLTNFGTQHRGNFKNIREHLNEKLSVFNNDYTGLISVVNTEDKLIKEKVESFPGETIEFGRKNSGFFLTDFEYSNDSTMCAFKAYGESKFLRFNGIWNRGQLSDFGAAYVIAKECGLNEPVFYMQEFMLPYSDRFALKSIKGRKILDDTYNSSLESLKTAAESIEKIKAKKKIAVIGSIFDQGKYSEESHKKIIDYLYPFDMILIYDSDKQIDIIKKYSDVKLISDDPVEISKWLLKNTFEEDLIYFKASRAVRIEEIIDVFKESE